MSLALRPVSAAFAVFAAAFAANANTTYYFQGTPGEETYIWGNTQWKTADGTAKTLFQNSSGTRDRTADAVITNGQLAVTETAVSDKEFCFLGNTLTISGEESESILRHNGSSFSYADVILKGNGALYLSGRYSTSKLSGIANTTTIEIDPDTTEEKPAILYIGDRNGALYSWGPISGSGYLKIALKTATAEKWMNFSVDNSSYTGAVAIVGNGDKLLGVNGEIAGSLFGNPPEFLEKGLVLQKGAAYYKYNGTLTANRGVYVKTEGGGLGAASGITGTIDSVITFEDANAVLQKVGAGTIELAGGIRAGSPKGTIELTNGTLKMKADDASKVNFTGAYPLVLTGSGTASFDDTLSTFTSTLTMKDTSTLDLSNGAQIAAAVTMEAGTSLKLPAPGSGAAAVKTISVPANTPVTFGDGSPVPDGLYKVLDVTGSADASTVAQNLSCQNVASSGGAVAILASGGSVYLAVGTAGQGDADICVWTGGGADNLFSTQDNWLGGKEPVAGESLSSILFNNGSAIEAVNDVGDIGVAKIVLNSSGVTTVSNVSGYKFTGVTNITTAADVHHVFNCPVECKDGVTPVVPGTVNNYVDFKGGLTAANLTNARPFYWCGDIRMTNSTAWVSTIQTGNSAEQALAGSGTTFRANEVNFGWFGLNTQEGAANTANVVKIKYDGGCIRWYGDSAYMGSGNWGYRWTCVSARMRSGSVLKVGELDTSGGCPEVFHSYAEAGWGESGIIEVNKITLGNTDYVTGKDERYPWIWFNRGWRGKNSREHTRPGTWAIGSGGLTFAANCNTEGKYRVGSCGATLNSFADWTLAAQGRGASNIALELDGGKLVINTDHYVTGDPEIDDGATPHTVTLTGRAHGTGGLIADGAGCVVLNYASDFTGGLVASNGVTLAVKAGCKPGAGTVTMCEGTKLFFPDAGVGTTAQMGEVSFAENTSIVFSNLSASVTVASASAYSFANPATTVLEFAGDGVLPDGVYPLFSLPGGPFGADLSAFQLSGSAIAGKTAMLNQRAGEVVLVVGNGGTPAVPTMIASGNMSDAANWLGGVVPSAETAYEGIVFDFSATNVVNDIGDITAKNIAFKTADAALVSSVSGYKFTGVTNMTTVANVHNVFACAVECTGIVQPSLPGAADNYVDFKGGVYATFLANTRPLYWCGDVHMANQGQWSPSYAVGDTNKQYLAGNGSKFTAGDVNLNWFAVNMEEGAANTVKVARVLCNAINPSLRWHGGNDGKYMGNGNWRYRWTCVADTMRSGAVLKANSIETSGACPELFHSYAEDGYGDSGIIEVNEIKHGSTTQITGADNQCYPYIWLNRGNRSDWKRFHTKPGTWAIGSGGLKFSSGCHNDATYRVGGGPGALVKSFGDWTLAAHTNGASRTALEIETNSQLEINTDHYETGDPEIDNGATPHTVTINGVITGGGSLLISGGGRVVFNSVSTFSSWMRVATELVLNPGSQPGAATVSVWNNGTLSMPASGCVTVGDNIVFGNQSTLKFTLNDNTDTNKLEATSVTLDSLGFNNRHVNVYVNTGSGFDYFVMTNSYTLLNITGEPKLTEDDLPKFKLQGSSPYMSLAIEDGNLVAKRKDFFYIRIAETGTLGIPKSWVASNVGEYESDTEEFRTAINSLGANGMPRWQSYCLGLNPQDAQSVVLCEAAPDQPADEGLFKFTTSLTLPENLAGVAVTAYLDRKSSGDWEQQGESLSVSNGTPVEFTVNADPDTALSFFV